MGRRCTVCIHPSWDEIERALVAGHDSHRGIARRFAVSPDAVERHVRGHLPAKLFQAHEAGLVANADDLRARLTALKDMALQALFGAETAKDVRGAVAGVEQLNRHRGTQSGSLWGGARHTQGAVLASRKPTCWQCTCSGHPLLRLATRQ